MEEKRDEETTAPAPAMAGAALAAENENRSITSAVEMFGLEKASEEGKDDVLLGF